MGENVTNTEQQQTDEEKFREALGDVMVIVKRLAPHCQRVDELIGVLQHAMENDGQLRLLMSRV